MAYLDESEALSATTKIFNDAVHGHMEFAEYCMRIIDTPQFQRLRDIKMAGGCYYVYPGASHNRFEHSLGVCYLAGNFLRHLRCRQPELNIIDDDIICVEIAALCHDLGHGPFSTVFHEGFMKKAASEKNWKVETASVMMFDHLLKENNLENQFTDIQKKFIRGLITGNCEAVKEKHFLYEIIINRRNGIDADTFDQIARDCYHLGIKCLFDHNRFFKFARVLNIGKNGEKHICTREKELTNLYDLLYTKLAVLRRAHKHPAVKVVEFMMVEALCEANEHLKIEGTNRQKMKLSDTVEDMKAFQQLSDEVFHRILYSDEPELSKARKILHNIQQRKLYKRVLSRPIDYKDSWTEKEIREGILYQISTPSTEDEEGTSQTISIEEKARIADLICVQIVEIDCGQGEENPLNQFGSYRKNQPDVWLQWEKDEVSKMLPDVFGEKEIRVYCRRDDEHDNTNEAKKIKNAFSKWCAERHIK